MSATTHKDKSKVRLRLFLGRIFNNSSSTNLNESIDSINGNSTTINEISSPFVSFKLFVLILF